MKITVTFDSLKEFQEHVKVQAVQDTQRATQEAQRVTGGAGPKEGTEKAEKDQGSSQEGRQEAVEGGADVPKVTEDFRVEVRMTLAPLNKKVGKNIASELIKGFGVDKLTEVALADLPALMSKAKEALNAE